VTAVRTLPPLPNVASKSPGAALTGTDRNIEQSIVSINANVQRFKLLFFIFFLLLFGGKSQVVWYLYFSSFSIKLCKINKAKARQPVTAQPFFARAARDSALPLHFQDCLVFTFAFYLFTFAFPLNSVPAGRAAD